MSDGMRRELVYLSSHATNRYFIPNWGNYVQPLVSVSVSVLVGLAVFKGTQALAALLVFSGVWLVIKSKSKHDIDKHDHSLAYEKRQA